MADSEAIRRKIRRKTGDAASIEIYRDGYYDDTVEDAVLKLSLDLGESYSSIEEVPDKVSHLIVLLASIDMCFLRAAAEISGNTEGVADSEDEEGISSITVPDLSVSSPETTPDIDRKGWMDLAAALTEEYDAALKKAETSFSGGAVSQGTVGRISRFTGGLAKVKLDRGLPRISDVSTYVSGLQVRVRWTAIYEETFNLYRIYRAGNSGMIDAARVASLNDNHTVSFTDTVPATGTYYYRVDVINMNDIVTEGSSVIARVL